MRVRVKICGITRPEDARAAARAGADAVGLVFWEGSSRHLSLEAAERVVRDLPAFVARTALFMDASAEAVKAVIDRLPVDLLQFHGSENEAFCARFGKPYIKALGMRGGTDVAEMAAGYPTASGLILDGHAPGQPGGGGQRFDWRRIPSLERPVILAGGLTPGNVGEAVTVARPWAVDVSSGVEGAPGIKDARLMERFIDEVNRGSAVPEKTD